METKLKKKVSKKGYFLSGQAGPLKKIFFFAASLCSVADLVLMRVGSGFFSGLKNGSGRNQLGPETLSWILSTLPDPNVKLGLRTQEVLTVGFCLTGKLDLC